MKYVKRVLWTVAAIPAILLISMAASYVTFKSIWIGEADDESIVHGFANLISEIKDFK